MELSCRRYYARIWECPLSLTKVFPAASRLAGKGHLLYLSALKSIAAIGLLMLLLFNLCGYRVVADWLQHNAESRLQAVIEDGSFDKQQLVELSVVTNLPYTNDWLDWERCNGTIEINGIHYQYVERKLEKGSMHYRCLPNHEKQTLVSARDQFFQLVNNFNQQNEQKSSSKSVVISNFIGDYDEFNHLVYKIEPFNEPFTSTMSFYTANLLKVPALIPHQPPEC